jgi:hypothetical protein
MVYYTATPKYRESDYVNREAPCLRLQRYIEKRTIRVGGSLANCFRVTASKEPDTSDGLPAGNAKLEDASDVRIVLLLIISYIG